MITGKVLYESSTFFGHPKVFMTCWNLLNLLILTHPCFIQTQELEDYRYPPLAFFCLVASPPPTHPFLVFCIIRILWSAYFDHFQQYWYYGAGATPFPKTHRLSYPLPPSRKPTAKKKAFHKPSPHGTREFRLFTAQVVQNFFAQFLHNKGFTWTFLKL